MAINLPAGYDLGPAIRKQGVGDALNAMVGGMERGQRIGTGFVNTELAIRDQMEQEKAARRKEAFDEAALLEAAAWEAGTQDIGGPGHLLRTGGRRRSSGGTTGGYSQALSAGAPIGISRAEAAEAMALEQQAAIEQDAANRAAMMGERSRLQAAFEQAAAEQASLDQGAAPQGTDSALTDYINRPAVFLPQSRLREGLAGTIDADVEMRGGTAGQHGGESGWWIRPEDSEEFLARSIPDEGSVFAPLARGRAQMRPPQEPAGPTSRPVSELQAAIGAYDKSLEALPQPKPVSKNPFHTRFGKNKLPDPKAVASAVRLASKGDYGMINEIAGRPVKKSELEGLYSDYEGYIVDVETFGRAKIVSDREKKLIEEEAKVQMDNESKRETLMAGIKLSLGEGGRSGLTEEQISDLAGGIADTWLLDKALGSAQLSNLLKMGTEDRATAALIAKEDRSSRKKGTAELQGLYPGLNVKYYDAARAADAALDTWLGQLNTLEERRTGGADPEAIKLLQLGAAAAYNNYERVRDDFKSVSGRMHKPKPDGASDKANEENIKNIAKKLSEGMSEKAMRAGVIKTFGEVKGGQLVDAAVKRVADEASEATSGDGARGGDPEEVRTATDAALSVPLTPEGRQKKKAMERQRKTKILTDREERALGRAKGRAMQLIDRLNADNPERSFEGPVSEDEARSVLKDLAAKDWAAAAGEAEEIKALREGIEEHFGITAVEPIRGRKF